MGVPVGIVPCVQSIVNGYLEEPSFTLQQINIDPAFVGCWMMSFHKKLVVCRVYVKLPEGNQNLTIDRWRYS